MNRVSISAAWDETKAVLRREAKLLVAVGLALFVLPGVVLGTVSPKLKAGEVSEGGPWMLVALVVILISVAGQLAVMRLAMGPQVSVGEAISHGFRRLLPYVASVLMWVLPLLLIAGAIYGFARGGTKEPNAIAAVLMIVWALLFIFISVRLILGSAVASAEHVGPIAILKRSWNLTAGSWWRLFAFLILFAIPALILLYAVGAVAALLATAMFGDVEAMSMGGLVVAILSQLVSALVSIVFFVMLARLYTQLAGRGEAQASVPSSVE
jgi:hypothetical protein